MTCAQPAYMRCMMNARPPTEAFALRNLTRRITPFAANYQTYPDLIQDSSQQAPNYAYRIYTEAAAGAREGVARAGTEVGADKLRGVISAETTAGAPERAGDRAAGGLSARWALLTALGGGLCLAAAFPPAGVWPLAAVGPALLVVALTGRGWHGSFGMGLVFGIAFFVPLLTWVINLAWYAWVALTLASAVIFAVLAIGQGLLLRLRAWPLAVAGWWVAAEGLRDRWPWGGFPWGRLAMSQAGAPTQGWVAIGGAPLLTFIVALTGAALAWLILE